MFCYCSLEVIKTLFVNVFHPGFIFFWVLMFPNSWEHTNRCLIKSTNYMLIRSDIKGLATSWAWERISTSLHRPTLTRTHNPCPHCLWVISTMWHDPPLRSWFYWASALTQPPILAFSSCRSMKCSLGRPELCSWVWAASTILNPSHNNGGQRVPPKALSFSLASHCFIGAACIWSLSPTEKLPPLSQEPPQHPIPKCP